MNQNPEQKARDIIDKQLTSAGWLVQKKSQIDLNAGLGVAVAGNLPIRRLLTEIKPVWTYPG
jgi:type I site-specific restriction endonuclease